MKSGMEINLAGVFGPIGLLKCHAAINAMAAGQRLSIVLDDPGVVAHLTEILHHRSDFEYRIETVADRQRIAIRRNR